MSKTDGRYPTTPSRGGRPLKIHTIVDRDTDGNPITAGEKLIELIRKIWMPWEDAAAHINVSSRQVREWRQRGAMARELIANWDASQPPVTANDRTLASFVIDLERAEVEAHARCLGVVVGAGTERQVTTKTVETIVNDTTKTIVKTTTETPPLWTAAIALMQARRPDMYRRRVELTGADGAPLSLAERADRIADLAESYLQGRSDVATEPAKQSRHDS